MPRRPCILFVDDDQMALDGHRRTFASEYEVIVVDCGSKGLAALESEPRIRVVVSDLKMPGMDGIAFLEAAKEMRPDTVRILLTGYADLQNALEAVNKGHIFRLLSKPCAPQLLSATIGDALDHYQIVLDSRELHTLKRLKTVMAGIVSGLSVLVESRDPYTAGHQRRVAAIACRIGEELGFSSERLESLHIVGMLHDIGKVYVPSDFLNKPGRLSSQEFAIINQHPVVGADILKDVDFNIPLSQIILQHHERMDGSGYPQGLRGDEILLEARIIAVADVVDAMSSRRPYREALGMDAALGNLLENKETLYDPEVVDVCVALFGDKGLTVEEVEKESPGG